MKKWLSDGTATFSVCQRKERKRRKNCIKTGIGPEIWWSGSHLRGNARPEMDASENLS